MPRLLRQLSIGLAVILTITIQGFAAVDAQHRTEHAVEFPGVPYSDAVRGHDHDAQADHDHHEVVQTAEMTSDAGVALDMPNEGESPMLPHHHHGGADIHLALSQPSPAPSLNDAAARSVAPWASLQLAGTRPDSPLDPPKQNA